MSSASSLRSLSVAPVRWRATPPGTAWAVQWPARSGAPPARAVASQPSCAALPPSESRPSWSDRRGPRCARLAPGAPQPGAAGARQARPARRRGRRALSRSLRSRLVQRFGSLKSPQGGRMAPLSAKPWARPGQAGALGEPRLTDVGKRPLGAGSPARTAWRLHSALGLRCAARPTAPAGAPVPAP